MAIDTDFHSHISPSSASQMVRAARARGLRVLGLSEHIFQLFEGQSILPHMPLEGPLRSCNEYIEQVREAARSVRFEVRLGLEVDFIPEKNNQIQALIEDGPWDFLIGSVHQIEDELFESHAYNDRQAGEAAWQLYFERLREAARSGFFSLISHPVRMRISNSFVPANIDQQLEQLALEASQNDVALEVNGQDVALYPAMVQRLLRACALHKTPISVGSDAHFPEQLMRSHCRSAILLQEAGISHVRIWKQRQPEEYSIL